MNNYQQQIELELQFWKLEVMKKPSLMGNIATKVQGKINSYIPQKVHKAITPAIKQMVKAVLFGSEVTSSNMP
ncbi:MAG: EcsC family protein, partial [Pedobacter sp.]